MAKADEFVSPANLWGKPLPGATSKAPKEKKEEKVTRMRTDEYEDEDVDADVDAELEEDVVDDEAAYAEADDYEDEGDEDVHETAAKLTDEEVADAVDDDDDETEYEPEAGDDDVSDEAVDSTVETDEDDNPVEAPKATKTPKGKVKDMAEKKSGADHIREEIERRQESGDSLRGVDIVAALAKKRVTVSPAQVSQLLKKAGVASGTRTPVAAGEERTREAARHKRKEEAAKAAPKRPVAKGPSGSTTLPMDQLKAATAFLAACDGCYDMAGEILAEHKKLRSVVAS